jgi:hypothetical protein
MIRWSLAGISLVVAVMAACCLGAARGEGFDKPLRKVVVDLGRPTDAVGPEHDRLTCYYYAHVMVKQVVNFSIKGAVRVSAIQVDAAKAPRCSRNVSAGEHGTSEYGGFFWGVKRDLVFFTGADGDGEGWHFWVFDPATLDKVFDDELMTGSTPDFLRTAGGRAVMRYPHVFFSPCSLKKSGAECWKKVLAETGVRDERMPKCQYFRDNDVADPSLVVYPVEVGLSQKFPMRVLAGAAKCFAQQ